MTRERWEAIKAKGDQRFFLIHGVLSFGVPVGLGLAVLSSVSQYGLSAATFLSTDFAFRLFLALLATCLMGYVVGSMKWSAMERRFSKKDG